MTANKKFWRRSVQFFTDIRSIMTRESANVRDPRFPLRAKKALVPRPNLSHLLVINVSVNSLYRFVFLQSFRNTERAYIPRMPYLVTTFDVLQNIRIEETVGIGNECNSFHKKNCPPFWRGQFKYYSA